VQHGPRHCECCGFDVELLGELCRAVGGGEVGLEAVAADVAWIIDQAPAFRALTGGVFAGQ
jgi:hypothetical protein